MFAAVIIKDSHGEPVVELPVTIRDYTDEVEQGGEEGKNPERKEDS